MIIIIKQIINKYIYNYIYILCICLQNECYIYIYNTSIYIYNYSVYSIGLHITHYSVERNTLSIQWICGGIVGYYIHSILMVSNP